VLPILASIPSPSDNAISIGGLELRAYGLAIALGVIAAVWIARRRWAARGGDPDDISRIALWAVVAGLIGARLYHVLTDLDRFEGRWLHMFAVWEGGLGIPGGLIAGVGTGAYIAHRRGLPVAQLLDVIAPALPVAQAIGRLGNWFNQELFGRPTDLPWGLEIDPAHRPAGYLGVATFHPTFLYEALWNLALAGGLVLWERHHPDSRPGRLFALYVAGYAVGRAWVEALRIDPAAHLFGVRWNIWMSAIAFVAAVGWLVFDSWRARRLAEREPSKAATATDEAAAVTTIADTADVAMADEPTAAEAAESADEPTAAEAAEPAENAHVSTELAAEEPATPGTADTSDAAEPEDQPDEGEAGPEGSVASETAATGQQPDTAEPADNAPASTEPAEPTEPADTAKPADNAPASSEPAAGPDSAEPADNAPASSEPAAGPDSAEPADNAPASTEPAAGPDSAEPAARQTSTDEPPDASADSADTSADAADTAQQPTNPGENDPEADGATGDEPVVANPEYDGATSAEPGAAQPTDPDASESADPEPGTEARAETADEDAAT
jgi:prolipoprotein diacylglyceryl transferase